MTMSSAALSAMMPQRWCLLNRLALLNRDPERTGRHPGPVEEIAEGGIALTIADLGHRLIFCLHDHSIAIKLG